MKIFRQMINRVVLRKEDTRSSKAKMQDALTIIPRAEHALSRNDISPSALKVLYRLHNAGYEAFLVGGGVRDVLLDKHPKDFDIATNALPEEVRKLFSNSMLIGRRFRLAHVRFGREIVEVATFRGHEGTGLRHVHADHGMIMRDNVYGNLEDDATRRDFTVNALYYNIADFSIVDYVDGMKDLESRLLRMIGDPNERYREDPVRMLRAVRLAAKLDLTIETKTADAINRHRALLDNVPAARLYDEVVKIAMGGKTVATIPMLQKYELFEELFPLTHVSLSSVDAGPCQRIIDAAMSGADQRYAAGKTLNPAFFFAVMGWIPFQQELSKICATGTSLYPAIALAVTSVLKAQQKVVAVPRRITSMVREIWVMQYHLVQTRRRRIFHTVNIIDNRKIGNVVVKRIHHEITARCIIF